MLGISDGNNFAFADVPREVNPGDAGACRPRHWSHVLDLPDASGVAACLNAGLAALYLQPGA